jgi:transcriptional regulator NrdR family protein
MGEYSMKVIKRNGLVQEFDIEKIKLTLERVSDEVNEPFTKSDIDNLTRAIQKAVLARGKEYIHSFEIHTIVVDELKSAGFIHIAQAYDDYQRKC